jgi:parallel beta-helix repeat protein
MSLSIPESITFLYENIVIKLYKGGKSLNRKRLAVGLILLLIGTSVIPITAQKTEKPLQTSRGDWLYVGGSGSGNYTRIQDAINDSHDGDTVFVYSGLYTETIVIPTAIRLIGESKNTTRITAKILSSEALISLASSNVTISEFTFDGLDSRYGIILSDVYHYPQLRNILISDNVFNGTVAMAIQFYWCDFCTITQNTFSSDHAFGIFLLKGSNCTITNNHINCIRGHQFDIYLSDISYCRVSNNSIVSHNVGLTLKHVSFTTISDNYFYNNTRAIAMEDACFNISIISNFIDNPPRKIYNPLESIGILFIDFCSGIRVEKNFIRHWCLGIMIENSFAVNISMNTFMKNNVHARFYNKYISGTTWNQNYWGRLRMFPKPIFGMENSYETFPTMIQFDWHPAQEPYDIGV